MDPLGFTDAITEGMRVTQIPFRVYVVHYLRKANPNTIIQQVIFALALSSSYIQRVILVTARQYST
jgi:hypothetical protein